MYGEQCGYSKSDVGRRRISNEEVAQFATENSDIMIAFASIDPHKGKMGAREAWRLIEEHGVKGFKFHPAMQGCFANDRMASIYEVIAEHGLADEKQGACSSPRH